MKCNNCGTILEEGAMFCHYCGSKVDVQPAPSYDHNVVLQQQEYTNNNQQTPFANNQPQFSNNNQVQFTNNNQQTQFEIPQPEPQAVSKPTKEKKSIKGKIILFSVIGVVLAIIIALVVVFFTSSAYKINKKLKADEFDAASELYNSKVKGKFIEETILDILIKDRVSEVCDEYEKEKIDYYSAIAELEVLNEMGYTDAKKKIEEYTIAFEADTALAKADEYYKNGEYENAITEYSKIPETNENYATAVEKLDKVYKDYIDSTVEKASSFTLIKDYKQAIDSINTALGVIPSDVDPSKLNTAKEECLTAYKTDVSNEVNALIAEEKWSDAFAAIDDAIAFDNNDYFKTLRTSTETKFVTSVNTTVLKYLGAEDYISAKRVAENALTILPENNTLKELKTKVEKATPTYLLDVCQPYEKSGYLKTYVNGETVKMGGNAYTNSFAFDDTGYAIFNLGGKYKTLTFYIGHEDNTDMAETTFKLYCDEVLKTEMVIMPEALPKKVTIDVTGVKQIKFTSTEAWGSPRCGFGNVIVK